MPAIFLLLQQRPHPFASQISFETERATPGSDFAGRCVLSTVAELLEQNAIWAGPFACENASKRVQPRMVGKMVPGWREAAVRELLIPYG